MLDWYILKKFLSTFFFSILLLILNIVVIDYTENNEKFVKSGVDSWQVFQYYLAFIPWIANLIAPITVFISSVMITAGLAAKTEIVAILSLGISFRRMLLPYFLGSLFLAGISFYANGWLIPNSNKFRIAFEVEHLQKPFSFSERDIHFKIGPSEYLYLESYNNRRNAGYRMTLERIEDGILTAKFSARKMVWNDSLGKWTIHNWELREIHDFGEKFTTGKKLDTLISITPEDFDNKYLLNEAMDLTELSNHIEVLIDRSADDVAIFQNEIYVRYMMPFTVIILTLMGVFVSAEKSTRGGVGYKIAMGFLIAFAFIIMFVLVKAIADSGSMNPLLAIWIPNLIGLAGTAVLYRFVSK